MYRHFEQPDRRVETKAELIELVVQFLEGEIAAEDSIAVFFELPGLFAPEVIVNPRANVSKKLEYYAAAYNDNLQLNNNNAVKIIGISFVVGSLTKILQTSNPVISGIITSSKTKSGNSFLALFIPV